MDEAALPDGWTIWNDEPDGRRVLAYRPDVFDSQSFPAPCLPTIFLSNGPHRNRRPERIAGGRSSDWYVTFYLEPDVVLAEERFESRNAAIEGTIALARRFVDGELDHRGAYQVPREAYLDRLDELVGRDA